MIDKVTISFPDLQRQIQADRGDNLLAVIREMGLLLDADCGGVGRCGKCRVVINDSAALACLTYVREDISVSIPSVTQNSGYEILQDFERSTLEVDDSSLDVQGPFTLAIDLGTTTIVGKLINKDTGYEITSFAELNTQISFGSDVISRINASLDDSSELSNLITTQIDKAIVSLFKEADLDPSQVKQLVIGGNTTMTYILLGLPCRSLGFAPFKAAYTYPLIQDYTTLFHTDTLSCEVIVLPFISAYVGGDLTAGLLSRQHDEDFILMDMGTNGELLFKHHDMLICTATAAGPAFEGGNIECGTGSMRGAISSVEFEDGAFKLKTIGAAPPIGICGSGILDLMAVLVREGFIDQTGLFTDKTTDGKIVLATDPDDPTKEVYFSQKDARQFQLAKSAVRTGLEIIIEEMGDVLPAKVFLAGGFGQNLDPNSAIAVGMLPESFVSRVQAVGNSCLSGLIKVAFDNSLLEQVEGRIGTSQEINLAAHRRFNDLFMEHMYFNVPAS